MAVIRAVIEGQRAGDLIGGPSSLATILVQTIMVRGGFDRMEVLRGYLAWWRDGGYDAGPIAEDVFDLACSGMPIDEATRRVHVQHRHMTAGCAPLHRNVVLAALPQVSDSELDRCVREETALTHIHPVAA
jgi:ADP-ribosylglycohydrolase